MGILKNITDEYFGNTMREEDNFSTIEIYSELKIEFKFEYYEDGEIYSGKDTFYIDEDVGCDIIKINTNETKGLAIVSNCNVILIKEKKNDKFLGGCFYISDEGDDIDSIHNIFLRILNKTYPSYKYGYSKIEIDKQDIPDEIEKHINICIKLNIISQE